jgi:hypothetical protein
MLRAGVVLVTGTEKLQGDQHAWFFRERKDYLIFALSTQVG